MALTGTGNSRVLSYTNFGNNTSVTVSATVGGVTDYVTIVRLKDGSDSITGVLSNEAHTLPASSAGVVSSFAGATSSLTVYKGTSNITSQCSFVTVATACTISGANTSTVTVTDMSADVAYVDISAILGGNTLVTKRFTITKTKAGTNGTNGSAGTAGAAAPKTTVGYVYYNSSTSSAPATPSASAYKFSDGTFTGLTSGWSTSISITGQGTFWAARYVVTEDTAGSDSGAPTFTAPFNHTNFSGLVTFTDQASALSNYTETWKFQYQGYTTIHGGNISTGTLTLDRLAANSTTTNNGVSFGLGYGSTLYGIACAGYFRTTNGGTAGLGAASVNSVGFAGLTCSSGSYAALFGNTYNTDTISDYYVVTGATIGGGNFGLFTQRKSTQGYSTSAEYPGTATGCYAKLAYLDGSTHFGARFFTTDFYGNDTKGVVIGGLTYSCYFTGPTGPFTGAHDAFTKSTGLVPGDIVCDVQVLARKDVSDTVTEVKISDRPNEKGVVGVYNGHADGMPAAISGNVTKFVQENGVWKKVSVPAILPEYQYIIDEYDQISMNSLGEGQINVCGEAGDMEVGDLIVTSSMPGKGMKQDDDIVRSKTVAKIRENVSFSGPTDVKCVACIYLCG